MLRNTVAVALVFALCGAAAGQETGNERAELDELREQVDELREELEEVVVTASRREAEAVEDSALVNAFRSVEVYGSVTGSYSWNLADPDGRRGANGLRLSDTDHNTFSLPYARLGVLRSVSGLNAFDAGFRLEVAAGRMVQEAFQNDGLFGSGSSSGGGGLAINVPQAYVDLQLPTPLNPVLLRVGRSYLPWGVESLDPAENPHFSLSYSKAFLPQTMTGLSLGMDLGAGLRYTQYVANGWDGQVVDDNSAKTFGGQLAWDLDGSKLKLAVNWTLGAERADSESDQRWAVETSVRWVPRSDLDLRASFHYGQEAFSETSNSGSYGSRFLSQDADTAKFGGFTLMAQKGFFAVEDGDYHRLALALRGSYFRDQGGSRTGLDQSLGEVTATLAFRPLRDAVLRFEYRRDFSSRDDAFQGSSSGSGSDTQDTISLSVSYSF